ncbi:MAG: hypothetical protein RLZZ598_1067 [Pseudomonadota bacterium]
MSIHRRAMLVGLGGVALLSAGCMTKPLRAANADGTYCYRIGKSYRPKLTCTPGPIPSEQVEAEAHQFNGAPDQLTIYLVRKRWGDTGHVIRVATPGGSPVDTVPESFARWRLSPGQHTLTLTWPEGTANLAVKGRAGEVLAVEIVGQIWAWGSNYRLEPADATEARDRAGRLRLVADVRRAG